MVILFYFCIFYEFTAGKEAKLGGIRSNGITFWDAKQS